MLVVCENCDTKYDIKDDVIPEQGAQLKCAKCEKMIFIKKKEELDEETTAALNSVEDNENKESEVFSDFDERPTIIVPEYQEELDEDSSSKSGISPNFLSETHKAGPSFDEVFDDFAEEVSNEGHDKAKIGDELNNTKEETPDIETDKPKKEEKVKKTSIDNALDDFFDDLVVSDKKDEKKKEKEPISDEKADALDIETASDSNDTEMDALIEDSLTPSEEEIKVEEIVSSEDAPEGIELVDDEIEVTPTVEDEVEVELEPELEPELEIEPQKQVVDDGETQEISTVKMEELKEKLKDGLSDTDFSESQSKGLDDEKVLSTKIFIKQEEGAVIEFKVEKDMIEWLKARATLDGVLYSSDNVEFSPILNHQLLKDVEAIIKKVKKDDEDLISAKEILGKRKKKEEKNYTLPVVIFGMLLLLLGLYALHLASIVKLSFLDSITPKPKVIIEKHTKFEGKSTKVKIKVKKEEVKKEEVKKEEVKKEEAKKEEAKKEEVTVAKIAPKAKRAFYTKARLASKAKKNAEVIERYLILSYNFPKDSEPYGVLSKALRKDKKRAKHASKFLAAFKAVKAKKPNKTVNKALILELLKK